MWVLNGPKLTPQNTFRLVRFCPWCGKKLPNSLRRQWFKELEGRNTDDPRDPKIPAKFLDERWYTGKSRKTRPRTNK